MKGDILIYDKYETKAVLDPELGVIELSSMPRVLAENTLLIAIEELDSIYAAIHKDDCGPVLDPDDVKVADDEPDCNKCVYHRICKIGHHSSDGCTAYAFIGELGNLLSQVTPDNKHGEWELEPAEVAEKARCGNCYYIDDIDDGLGDCYRYPPNSNTIVVEDCQRACGEHRLRE